MSNVYVDNGYKNREDYLRSLADEYDLDFSIVLSISETLGPSEDFDGLISILEEII